MATVAASAAASGFTRILLPRRGPRSRIGPTATPGDGRPRGSTAVRSGAGSVSGAGSGLGGSSARGVGGAGSDLLDGGDGVDIILGGNGHDRLTGGIGAFAYHTSKWAVRGMTKAAAVENGRRNVRVNSIHPGLIDTDMLQQVPGAEDEMRLTRRVPLGRAAEAVEVAKLALFLASDESSYSTGAEFVIDGGLNAL